MARKNQTAPTVAANVVVDALFNGTAPTAAASVVAPAPALAQPPAVVLDGQTRAALRADGAAAYDGECALIAFANLLRPVMATATQAGDYARYIETARQWRIGYEQAKRNTGAEDVALSDRSQSAWERRLKAARQDADGLGDQRLLGDIPKAAAAAAVKKAEQRNALAEVAEAAAKEYGKPAAIRAAAAAMLASEDVEARKKGETLIKAAKVAEQTAKVEADKAAREAIKAQKDRLAELVKQLAEADNVDLYKKAITALGKVVTPYVQARAKKEAAEAAPV